MYFLLLLETFAHAINILCNQLFNIQSKQNRAHSTVFRHIPNNKASVVQ